MDLSSEQLIAVVLALVSGILFLFRRSDKVIWHQFDTMKLRQEHTNTKLIDCEKNHALVHEQILHISIKLERELGKKEGAGEVADRVIAHIDGRARS